MKKIILFVAICLSAISCKVSNGEIGFRTKGNLIDYTKDVEQASLEYSVDVLEILIALDEYLTLQTDEERKDAKWDELRYHMRMVQNASNTYVYDSGKIVLNIRTDGRLADEDHPENNKTWSVVAVNMVGWNFLAGSDTSDYWYYDEESDVKTMGKVRRVAANTFEISVNAQGKTEELLKLILSRAASADADAAAAGMFDYTITSFSGKVQKDDHGYWAEFHAENDVTVVFVHDIFNIDNITMKYGKYYNGKFYLKTCSDQGDHDWCRMTLGEDPQYETSLD